MTDGTIVRHPHRGGKGGRGYLPAVDHPAIIEGRTVYTSTVKDPAAAGGILKSGHHNPKIGRVVTKGCWKGFPIFMLTLEERKTCPRSCGSWRSCVVPGTKVITADLNWTPIEYLRPGDELLAFDEDPDPETGRRRSRISTVEKIGQPIQARTLRIRTDQGEISASDDHLWLARPPRTTLLGRKGFAWTRSDQLKIGDAISFFLPPWEPDRSYEAGRIRGFIEGEGHLSTWGNTGFPKTRAGWSQRPGRLHNEINDIVRSKGFSIGERHVASGVRKSDIVITEILGGWRQTLRFMGMIRPSRLMDKVKDAIPGHIFDGRAAVPATILGIDDLGVRDVVPIQTSSRTLITDGFLSHNCYGNNVHLGERWQHGPELEQFLVHEVVALQNRYPSGFAVRLHILGDFYSVDYVLTWRALMETCPALHVFGFTARIDPEEPITRAVAKLRRDFPTRWWMRFSGALMETMASEVVELPEQATPGFIVCPQQTGRTLACATCGLCWASNKSIAFLRH